MKITKKIIQMSHRKDYFAAPTVKKTRKICEIQYPGSLIWGFATNANLWGLVEVLVNLILASDFLRKVMERLQGKVFSACRPNERNKAVLTKGWEKNKY